MKRILIFVILIFLSALVGYYLWFGKAKDLNFIPENADSVILIDVKKASNQYILTMIKHPSLWSVGSKSSVQNNGIKVPDYIQIFHLKNTSFSEWYSVFKISDDESFLKFLKKKGFKSKNGFYTKDQFSIRIDDSKCIVGFSNPAFEKTTKDLINSKKRKLCADQLINNSIAGFSYFLESGIHNFAVHINDDNIEVKNKSGHHLFSSGLSDLEENISFLKFKLNSKNIQKASKLFNKKLSDSININSLSAFAELEMVNDKILSYSYDDDFNEVEKVSYQKILQPHYVISIQSLNSEKTWSYFQHKKWINAQNQFTAIPFQPNIITKKGNEILIKSTRKEIEFGQNFPANYIFLKNNPLLINSIKSFSASEKKAVSNIDYLFYGNKEDDYYLKLKFKKEKLPIILRW